MLNSWHKLSPAEIFSILISERQLRTTGNGLLEQNSRLNNDKSMAKD